MDKPTDGQAPEEDSGNGNRKSLQDLAADIGLVLDVTAEDKPDKVAVFDPSRPCVNPALLQPIYSEEYATILNKTYPRLKTPLKVGDVHIKSPFHILFSMLPISSYVHIARVLSQIMSDPRGVESDFNVTHPIDILDMQVGGAQAVWEQIVTLLQLFPNILFSFISRSGCVTTLGKVKQMLLDGVINKSNANTPDEIVKEQERMKGYLVHLPAPSSTAEIWPPTTGNFNGVPYAVALGGKHNGQILIPPWGKIGDVILGKFKPPPNIEGATEDQIREWWVPLSNPSLLTHLTGHMFNDMDEDTIKKSDYLPELLPFMRSALSSYLQNAVAMAQISCALSCGVISTNLALYGDKRKNGLF